VGVEAGFEGLESAAGSPSARDAAGALNGAIVWAVYNSPGFTARTRTFATVRHNFYLVVGDLGNCAPLRGYAHTPSVYNVMGETANNIHGMQRSTEILRFEQRGFNGLERGGAEGADSGHG
jgi:hypothetical protein